MSLHHVNLYGAILRFISGSWVWYLLPLCLSSYLSADIPENPENINGAQSFIYKKVDDIELRLHVFNKDGDQSIPRPLIVFFFGGGFMQGSVTQFVPHCKLLADQGMMSVVADYRVKLRHGTSPVESIGDGIDAILWLRAKSSELNFNPSKVIAGGGSSGGYIAAAAAHIDVDKGTEDLSSRPNALALFNPVLGYSESRWRFSDGFGKYSPYMNLHDSSVPTFIVHGKDDSVVPYLHAKKYCEKVNNLNGYCELHGYEGAEHAFFNVNKHQGMYYRDTTSKLIKFLQKNNYL